VARVLAELAGLLPAGPVYVIAHSMGNRLLTEGYTQLLEDQPGRARAFREIIMAAPDVDQEDFRLDFAPRMLSSGPRFTLYASEHDLALGSSEWLQGGKRLGFGGQALFVERGIDSVDASAVTKEFFSLNHSYFGDTTTVLADIFHLIRRRLPPAERPHLKAQQRSDGKAWTLGGAP
jgi:esterase/lipase superfamily enzyme